MVSVRVPLFEDNQKTLWVDACAAGLNLRKVAERVQNSVIFSHYIKGKGLSGNTVYAILESPSSKIWLSINRDPSELQTETGEIRHFDKIDGIGEAEFNFGARLRNHADHLMFGGTAGMVVF